MAPAAISRAVFGAPPMWIAPTVNSDVTAWVNPCQNECVVCISINANPSTRLTAQNSSCAMSATGAVGARIESLTS